MAVWTGQSPQRRALVEAQARESLFGDALNFPFPELADGLGLTDLGESFRGPLHSDVPVLFFSGTLDGRTPPANARALLPGFSKGRQLLVRGVPAMTTNCGWAMRASPGASRISWPVAR